jgi:hypothetical protein
VLHQLVTELTRPYCLQSAGSCSDEVYANSLFDDSQQFVSTAHLLQQEVLKMEGSQHAGALQETRTTA